MLVKFSQNFSTNQRINQSKDKPKKVSLHKFYNSCLQQPILFHQNIHIP
jgi:hypothetical protein